MTPDRCERSLSEAAITALAEHIHALQAQLEAVRRERDFIATQRDDLANALDAERTRREQVEMANHAKDGQIETLRAVIVQLRDWRDHVTLALKREGGARFEDVPGYVTALRDERDRLAKCLSEMVKLVDDFMPNVGRCVLQNYQRLNDAPLEARQLLAALTPAAEGPHGT